MRHSGIADGRSGGEDDGEPEVWSFDFPTPPDRVLTEALRRREILTRR